MVSIFIFLVHTFWVIIGKMKDYGSLKKSYPRVANNMLREEFHMTKEIPYYEKNGKVEIFIQHANGILSKLKKNKAIEKEDKMELCSLNTSYTMR